MKNKTKIKLTIPIPIDRPNANGVIYTKDAVTKAMSILNKNIPILYRDKSCEKVIGSTTGDCHIVRWDFENQVCNLTVDGVLFSSGVDVMINEVKDGEITNFKITNIGINGEYI